MFKKQLTLLCLVLLVGCTPRPEAIEAPRSPVKAAQSPKTLSSWTIQGLIGIRNGRKAWSANLNWLQQGPNQYHLRLSGPLGGGTILIDKAGNQVTYQDGKKHTTATQASVLLRQQTGIQLPVESLYYWIKGMPAPGVIETASYDAAHQLTHLKQFGYDLTYTNYQSIGAYELPGSVKLQGRGLLVKVVIKQWKIS